MTERVPPRDFRLSPREAALVVAFWTLLAVLNGANRMLDPRAARPEPTFSSAPMVAALVESALWAMLTVPIFWLAYRTSGERVRSRLLRVLLYLAAGVAVALLVSVAMDLARQALFPPPPFRRGRGAGPRIWEGRRLLFLNYLVTYAGVLAAGVARDYSRRYRARQEDAVRLRAEAAQLQAQLAEARLDALRRQLDPHFLFNTLHAVSSLVERDPRGVRRMIARLSELLRYSIEGSAEQEVPLRTELEMLGRYLDIMQVRFQGKLEVTTRADGPVLGAMVPSLVLQPLVENAIKHGVSRVEGSGRIDVSAELAGGEVVLRVRDNGPDAARGVTEGASAAPSANGGGVGLRNTTARLQQLYGGGGRFALRAADGGGTVAEIRIPYRVSA